MHAGFGLYWAAGGSWLVWSLGTDLVEQFRGREWLLAPIGWGGLNTAVANLVLAGLIRPDDGFDRPGMIGHA